MNKYLWTIGVAFLMTVTWSCVESSKEAKQDKISAEEQARLDEEKARQDSLNAIKVKELKQYFYEERDEFNGITWVFPKTKPKYTNQNGYYMYFQKYNSYGTTPRFRIQYESDSWLFIRQMIFNIDGENITFTPEKMETDCGNGGRIWEWCDEPANDLEPLISKIAYAKSVKIKMVGQQYYDVKTMTPKQIEYFKYSYEYYKAINGTFN